MKPLPLPYEIKKRKLPSVIIQGDANSNFCNLKPDNILFAYSNLYYVSNALCPFPNGAGQTAEGTYHNGKELGG